MAGRIQVDPEPVVGDLTRLRRVLPCTERQHFPLNGVHIVHRQIEVKLLRPLTGRPRRGRKLLGELERNAQPVDLENDPVITICVDFSPKDILVKRSQCPGIGAVDDHGANSGEWHDEASCHETDGVVYRAQVSDSAPASHTVRRSP